MGFLIWRLMSLTSFPICNLFLILFSWWPSDTGGNETEDLPLVKWIIISTWHTHRFVSSFLPLLDTTRVRWWITLPSFVYYMLYSSLFGLSFGFVFPLKCWILIFWGVRLSNIPLSRVWWDYVNVKVCSWIKFLHELLGRTIMVNPCLSILGNNISHHTCFPRMLSLSYQQIEIMSSMSFPLLMSLELGWPWWLWPIKYGRCEARWLWNEVIKI